MNKKHINKKIYFRLGAIVLFSIFFSIFAFPINIFGVTRENKIVLSKGVDLVSSPECDLVDKDKLPSRFYTVEDTEGNKYFCLNEALYYPSNTEYEIENSIEVASDSVRWLIYNYNYNSNYFAGVNDLTAYGATQIAIWHYTENREGIPDYEKNNPLVMQLIQDSANVDFPSLETILSSYEATMQVENPMLELEGDEYVGQFTVSVNSDITHENVTVEIVPSDFTVRNGITTIHDEEGVNIQEVSSGVYTIRINKELIDSNDPVTVGYYANVTGESLVALEAFPNAVMTQSVGYTDTITLSRPINAYAVFEINDKKWV